MAVHTVTMPIHPRAKMPSAIPAITATALLATTPHEVAMLHDISELLNHIFTRNRNQHRRSHWWKSLHAFRKQIALLLLELEGGKKNEREGRVQARLRYWDEKCIHQWY
jgi:ribonuclease MRP protein subunit RMP1